MTEDERAKVLEEEKYPTLDELRDSTAIESTNSLDLVGLKQLMKQEKEEEEEEKSLPLRKKRTILEECAESILNEARNHSDGQETNEEVPEPQIVYHVKRLAELASRSAPSCADRDGFSSSPLGSLGSLDSLSASSSTATSASRATSGESHGAGETPVRDVHKAKV